MSEKYRKSLALRIKDSVRWLLKHNAIGGGAVYAFFQKCWRAYAIPRRQKRLHMHGPAAIRRLHELLSNAGVRYYADGGTLLGFIRDHGFIKHDDDMDISIHPGGIEPSAVLKLFIDAGYGFLHGFDYNGRIMEFSVVDVSGIPIDVFFPSKAAIAGKVLGHHPIWDPMRQYPSEKANTMYEFEFAAAAGFKEVMILGERVVVPTNAEEILTTEYGPWQIPDAKFNNIADRVFRELPGYAYRVTADEILAR